MAREKKSLLEKIQDEYPEFTSEVDGLNVQELKNRIANYAKALQESEESRDADEDLKRAKEEAKELGAPYRDIRKAVKLKTRYLISLIVDKGGQ